MKRFEIIEILENLEGVKLIKGSRYFADLGFDEIKNAIEQLGFREEREYAFYVQEDRYSDKVLKVYVNKDKALEVHLQIHKSGDDEKITFHIRNTPDFLDRLSELASGEFEL